MKKTFLVIFSTAVIAGSFAAFFIMYLLGENETIVIKEKEYVTYEDHMTDLVKKMSPSIVTIMNGSLDSSYGTKPSKYFTGVIMTDDGLVFTSKSNLEENINYKIVLYNNLSYPVKDIVRDPLSDIAILIPQISTNDVFAPAPVERHLDLQHGERIFIIGNNYQRPEPSLYTSIITDNGKALVKDNSFIPRIMTIDQSITQGDLGGPVIHISGNIIGITKAHNSISSVQSVTLVDNATTLIQSIEKFDTIVHAQLPFEYQIIQPQIHNNTPPYYGAYITGIFDDVLYEKSENVSNTIENGDIILSIDNKDINYSMTVEDIIKHYLPEDTVQLQIFRYNALEIEEIEDYNAHIQEQSFPVSIRLGKVQ